jgi:hypothetical protein
VKESCLATHSLRASHHIPQFSTITIPATIHSESNLKPKGPFATSLGPRDSYIYVDFLLHLPCTPHPHALVSKYPNSLPQYSLYIHQMLFRRRSRSHDSPVVQIVGDCSVQVSPTQARKTDTRHTLKETYVSSPKQTKMLHKRGGSSDDSYRSSSSSPDQSPVQRKEPTPRGIPTSKKTGYATIRTDSTDTQPAFESDAFAVLMPTTRLPILDRPITRTKPAPSKAAVAAAATCVQNLPGKGAANSSEK